jgi:hypothetical protein
MAVTLGGVELPDDLAWPDRYDWQPVTVNTQYSLTGALLVESSTKLAGRPITLQSADNRSWVTRAVVESVKDLQAVAGQTYSLSVRDEDYTVIIVEVIAEPLWDLSDDSDYCVITIKLITVQAD